MKSFYLLIASILLLLPAAGKTQKIKVRTQQQFDEAIKKINQGEKMHLQLACKTFFLKENVVAKAPLSIESNKAVINSSTSAYTPRDAVREEDGYYIYKQIVLKTYLANLKEGVL